VHKYGRGHVTVELLLIGFCGGDVDSTPDLLSNYFSSGLSTRNLDMRTLLSAVQTEVLPRVFSSGINDSPSVNMATLDRAANLRRRATCQIFWFISPYEALCRP
jgi:hypothetical protein